MRTKRKPCYFLSISAKKAHADFNNTYAFYIDNQLCELEESIKILGMYRMVFFPYFISMKDKKFNSRYFQLKTLTQYKIITGKRFVLWIKPSTKLLCKFNFNQTLKMVGYCPKFYLEKLMISFKYNIGLNDFYVDWYNRKKKNLPPKITFKKKKATFQ